MMVYLMSILSENYVMARHCYQSVLVETMEVFLIEVQVLKSKCQHVRHEGVLSGSQHYAKGSLEQDHCQ